MQVQSANNQNNSNFGAKLIFADKAGEKLLNYHYVGNSNHTQNILDKFEKYMPEHTVQISIKKCRPIAQDWLIAKNITTGYTGKKNLTSAERIYPMNYDTHPSGSSSLYALLELLLRKDISWHNEFWGISPKVKSQI